MKTRLPGVRRSISWVVLVAFIVTQHVGSGPSWAEGPASVKVQKILEGFNLKDVSVSSGVGRILHIFNPPRNDVVIFHVRDLHCAKEAQLNISRIVDELSRKYGAELVLTEGAVGDVNTALFGTFPDEGIRQKVTREFLEQGVITGPCRCQMVEGSK